MLSVFLPVRIESEQNRRDHWSARKRRQDKQRLVTRTLLRQALIHCSDRERATIADGAVTVCLVRCGVRALDDDNLAGGFKAIRDEIAKLLGHDDGPSSPLAWAYDQEKDKTEGATIELWARD